MPSLTRKIQCTQTSPFSLLPSSASTKKGFAPMNKLNKEKRGKLGLIGVGTTLVTLMFYFFIISPQRQQIHEHEDKIVRTSELLDKNERWIRQRPVVQANLTAHRQTLETSQTDMAPLDKANWFYNLLENFQSPYVVSLNDIKAPEPG